METSKMRQIIFYFENNSNFKFDVSQSIRIFEVKRMIETALQIPRYKIRLYHENIDYTELDDSRLEVLFPATQQIVFKVTLLPIFSNSQEEKEIALNLRLGEYCNQHDFKYPCHFCFDCNKSFCSICNIGNLHADHETIEKYDYLQDSQIIVNRIFSRTSEDIKNLRFENEEHVIKLEAYFQTELFNKLRDLITEIEYKIRAILKVYLNASKNSLKQIENNLNTIKQNCSEALNSRKEELQMQNILIDESVVINYYNTIMQIHNQKLPVENDKMRFFDLVNSLSIVKPVVEDLYNDIKVYLMEKLNIDLFFKCEKEILKNKIEPVNIETVKTKLCQDIFMSTSNKPIGETERAQLLGLTPKEFSILQSGKKRFHHFEKPFDTKEYIKDEEKYEILEKRNEEFIIEPLNNINKQEKVQELISETIESAKMATKNINQSFENIKDSITDNINQSIRNTEILEHEKENPSISMEVEESVWIKKENENYVFTIQPESRNVYVYSDQRQKVKKYVVNFPILKFEKIFLKGCSWVNANGKLYISGGFICDGTFSDELLMYDNMDNSITLLNNLKEKRANHSMYFYDKNIYIIGGEGSQSIEIFNIFDNNLISKDNINFEAPDNPILWIHNGFIYSFFGMKNGFYIDFVQRANLKSESKNLKWEKISYKKTDDITCNIFGSGIIPCGKSEIYFFGGRTETGTVNQSMIFNFDSKKFSNADVPLEQGQYFEDAKFIELGDRTFGQFSLTECDNFLKINVTYA